MKEETNMPNKGNLCKSGENSLFNHLAPFLEGEFAKRAQSERVSWLTLIHGRITKVYSK